MQSPESSPIAARLAEWAQACPAHPAITFRGDTRKPNGTLAYDFAKLWRRVERVTAHLQAHWGVQPGKRVAWLGLNHELQLITLVACARLGAIFLPLNFRLAQAELQQVMHDAQPSLLVYDTPHAETALALQGVGLQHTHHDSLIATAAPRGLPLPAIPADVPLLLVYTSGTTGLPKGAVHTQAALMANARASAWAHEFRSRRTHPAQPDKVLSTLPLFHVGGLCIQTLPALLAGVEVVLHSRFESTAWLDELALSQPTLSLLVPATMRALFEHPRWDSSSLACLRGIMTGSSTVPVSYLNTLHARGVPVGQVYGTTETGPVSIVLRLPDAMDRVGASGWPHPHAQVKLIDAQGQEVGPGQTGEVCIRANNLMRGYWSADGQAGVGLQDGWFHSGDLGQRAEDGCITIVGRSKDMIISGGENIYPAEIEGYINEMKGVAESAVVGVPHPDFGEVGVAVVIAKSGAVVQPEIVLAELKAKLANFKIPKRCFVVAELPRNTMGKVQKNLLREQYKALFVPA